MAYAQKNYNELQGMVNPANGKVPKYSIRSIGCFLTSFSNLLERFGKGADPLTLNRVFRERGIFIDVDDGIRDDLGWQSITGYNPHIVCNQTGTGKPPHNNAIVKFNTKTNNFGTHFCLVADVAKGLIIDSWDGQVKSWNTYGGPVSWAAYADITPQPVQPPKPKPAPAPAPKPAPTGPNYDGNAITVQPGWGVSHAAKAAGFPDWASEARWNAIAKLNGHAGYSTFKLSPNQRIVVGKYVAPAPTPPPAPKPVTPAPAPKPVEPPKPVTPPKEEDNKVPVVVVPTDPNAYQKTYQIEKVTYIAEEDSVVKDFTGRHMDLQLAAGQKVNTIGTFIKDGVKYVRVITVKPENANAWYAVPHSVLESEQEQELFDADTIHEARELLNNLSSREKFVALVAKIQGFWISLLTKLKIKKVS